MPNELPDQKLAPALEELARRERHISAAYEAVGLPRRRSQPRGFNGLLRIVMAQQLSVHAARAIIERLDDATGCDPIRFAALSDSALRSVGLSPQKITYGRELARAVTSGVLNFRKIYRLRGDDVIAALTEVKGIALDGRNLLYLCAGPARRHACR